MMAKCLLGLPLVVAAIGLGLLIAPAPLPEAQAGGGASLASYQTVQWPATNPVWKFTWIPPTASSGMENGRSGIELRNVYYKGHEVLYQAHVPVLNVLYEKTCLAPSYRDWQNQLAPFQANNVKVNGNGIKDGIDANAEPTAPAKTTSD